MSNEKDKTLVEVLAESLRTWLGSLPDDTESESEGDDVHEVIERFLKVIHNE